jgi:hypothetical protein
MGFLWRLSFRLTRPARSEHSSGSSRRSKQLAKSLLLGGKIVFLALLVMAMLMPVLVKLHLGFVHRTEVRRVYRVRAFQHRTAFHFQPAMNWMNGEDPSTPQSINGNFKSGLNFLVLGFRDVVEV